MDKETYILQFPVSMADVEVRCLVDYERAYYKYEEILECSGYTHSDYLMHMIPENVYQNLKVIDWFLSACLCGSYQFGSLLPGKTVEPSLIKIVEQYA